MALPDKHHTKEEIPLRALESALAEVEDLYIDSRQMPSFLVGQTLKSLMTDGVLAVNKIEVAIVDSWQLDPMNGDTKTFNRALAKKKDLVREDEKITFTSESGVPVEMIIVIRKSDLYNRFFVNLNQ